MNLLAFKVAYQNILRQKDSSIVSMLGLSIAFAALLFIYFYVSFELGYDTQYKNSNRIYRVSGDIVAAENTMTHAVVGPLMSPGLKDEFPSIEAFARLIPIRQSITLEAKDEKYSIEEAYTVDHSVFDVFTLDFVYGNKKSALANPNEIVICKSLSKQYFGHANPIGETIKKGNQIYTIKGVVKDSPKNSHHKLNVLFSMGNRWENLEGIPEIKISEAYWMPSAFHFVLLKPKTKIEDISKNFESFYQKYMAKFGTAINAKFKPVFIPLKDLHFSRHMSYDYPKGNRSYTYLLVLIGTIILIIAIVNYVNLLLSKNIEQAKNTGIKKIIGANRLGIYIQQLINSLTFIGISVLLAIIITSLLFATVMQVSGINEFSYSLSKSLIISLIIWIATSFVTSLIPYLSQVSKNGLQLINPLHSKIRVRSNFTFGKVSTIIQYSLSTALIISVLLISRQINFLLKSEVGFDKENIVLLKVDKDVSNQGSIESLKNELLKSPMIDNVSFSSRVPGDVLGTNHFQIERDGKKVTKIVKSIGVDYNYLKLMNIHLKKGRNFSKEFSNDSRSSVIVNESLIDFCGFTDDLLGEKIGNSRVIGIVKDVCFNSLHNSKDPLIFYLGDKNGGYLNIKLLSENNMETSIDYIQKTWDSFYKDVPIEIQFLDNRMKMMYKDDLNKKTIIEIFTLVSIVISLMGLFNLSSLIAKSKIKEIGIRKVNGAKVTEILTLLNKGFISWILVSFIIACPIANYAVNKWLENFAYKTDLSWWIFALAGVLALGIALLAVSWQSWKAARRNPVEALRYE